MWFLPHRKLRLRSALSASEAVDVLANAVGPPGTFPLLSGKPPFRGTLNGYTFVIQRMIRYRNSSLPWIHGTISADRFGCSVAVEMTLPPLAMAFTLLCLGGAGTSGLAWLVTSLSGSSLSESVLVIGAVLAYGWFLVMAGFFIEA